MNTSDLCRSDTDTSTMLQSGVMLPLARYRFDVALDEAPARTTYLGSVIRGALGPALRGMSCVTGAPECTGCRFLSDCAWPRFFAREVPEGLAHPQRFSEVPAPFVIECEPHGFHVNADTAPTPEPWVQFRVVLIGRALTDLSLLIMSVERLFARGLAKGLPQGILETVMEERPGAPAEPIWERGRREPPRTVGTMTVPEFAPDAGTIALEFLTPLRLQRQGAILLDEELSPRRLIATLIRRCNLLFAIHAEIPHLLPHYRELVELAANLDSAPALTLRHWSRYSARQGQKMDLSGLVGRWELHGDLAPLRPLLWLGEQVHVGKTASMGLGQYRLR